MKRWTVLLVALMALSSCEFGTTLFGGYDNPFDTSSQSSASLPLAMVRVPAGSFQRDSNAANISTITTAFWMSSLDITRLQFSTVMGTDPSNASTSQGMNDPVQNANWYHAIAFCNRLSLEEGFTPVYTVSGVDFATLSFSGIPTSSNAAWDAVTMNASADGYRLPTEMEWMWAAMGATSDRANGYTGTGVNTTGYTKGYAGSTEPLDAQVNMSDFVWTAYSGGATTHPVGTKLPNELGLYDMSGNVAQWCWDLHNAYPAGPLSDYECLASADGGRIYRGGSYGTMPQYVFVAYRSYYLPAVATLSIGFRVVRR